MLRHIFARALPAVAAGVVLAGWPGAVLPGSPAALSDAALPGNPAALSGSPAAPSVAFPGVAAAHFVLADGAVVFAADAHRRWPPASLAKLAAVLVVTDTTSPDAVVTVSPRAAAATGSRAGLRAGDRLRVRDLVAAAMMASGNDACLALAEHVSGSEAAFVAAMNVRVRGLGLSDTAFTNACGHDAPGMRTSAADMATLARAALAVPAIATWARTEAHSIRTLGGRELRLRNTNAFVGRVAGVTGLKTGYTAKAGRNLVLTAEREGHRVVVVLLGARDRWWDAAAMLERAFDTVLPR